MPSARSSYPGQSLGIIEAEQVVIAATGLSLEDTLLGMVGQPIGSGSVTNTVATVTVGGGSRNLTALEYGANKIAFVGVLAADETYNFPNSGRAYDIESQHTGPFKLRVSKAGGPSQVIPVAEPVEVWV